MDECKPLSAGGGGGSGDGGGGSGGGGGGGGVAWDANNDVSQDEPLDSVKGDCHPNILQKTRNKDRSYNCATPESARADTGYKHDAAREDKAGRCRLKR